MTIGLYDDGSPGELFINMSKEGSTVGGLMDTIGVLTSFALQYGVPVGTLANKMRNNRFEPYGLVFEGDPDIKTAVSVTDYIFSYIAKQFNYGDNSSNAAYDDNDKNESQERTKITADSIVKVVGSLLANKNNPPFLEQEIKNIEADFQGEPGGFCIKCGTQMIKFGHCEERCPKTGCDYIDYTGCGK